MLGADLPSGHFTFTDDSRDPFGRPFVPFAGAEIKSFALNSKRHSRKTGVELGAKLLDRENRVLVLWVRALKTVVHARAQTVAGQGDIAPETLKSNR